MSDESVSRPPFNPTAKSRRCYHRVISGIERGGRLRFLTLTSGKDSPDTCQRSFRALYMRLKRRNLIRGYIKVPELSKNGKQHLHVLFRGNYVEQAYLKHCWEEIHHASVIDIRKTNPHQPRKYLAGYMAKYLSKENTYRYSWNWDWVWCGFCRDWQELKRRVNGWERAGVYTPFSELLRFWRSCLWAGTPDMIYKLPLPEI